MKKSPRQFRQGDVALFEVKKIPAEAKPVAQHGDRLVLAYGEVTGHAHAIAADNIKAFKIDGQNELYLDLQKSVDLNHEEHSKIAVPKGKYRVIIQREYSPEEIRNVVD